MTNVVSYNWLINFWLGGPSLGLVSMTPGTTPLPWPTWPQWPCRMSEVLERCASLHHRQRLGAMQRCRSYYAMMAGQMARCSPKHHWIIFIFVIRICKGYFWIVKKKRTLEEKTYVRGYLRLGKHSDLSDVRVLHPRAGIVLITARHEKVSWIMMSPNTRTIIRCMTLGCVPRTRDMSPKRVGYPAAMVPTQFNSLGGLILDWRSWNHERNSAYVSRRWFGWPPSLSHHPETTTCFSQLPSKVSRKPSLEAVGDDTLMIWRKSPTTRRCIWLIMKYRRFSLGL